MRIPAGASPSPSPASFGDIDTLTMQMLRALLIDEDTEHRCEVRRLLELASFECCEASGLFGALPFASSDGIDLIVADLASQRIGALALTELMKAGLFGEVPPPIIAYFDAFELTSSVLADREDMDCLMPKPVDTTDLQRALQEVFGPAQPA